jgi:hypothetical protein
VDRFSHERGPQNSEEESAGHGTKKDPVGATDTPHVTRAGQHYASMESKPSAEKSAPTLPTRDTSFEPQTVSQHAQKAAPADISRGRAYKREGSRSYNPADHRAAPHWVRSILPHVPQGATVTKTWDILSPETVARLSRRRKGRRILIVLILVVALALLASGIYLYQRDQSGRASLDQSLQVIQEADDTIVPVDQSIDSNVTADTVDSLTTLVAQRDDAADKLDQARDLATQAQGSLFQSSEREVASEAIVGIDARKEMLDEGTQIIQNGIDAYHAAAFFSQAWDLIIDANSSTRSAAGITLASDAESAKTSTTTASDDLAKAKDLIDQAQTTYQAADFSTLLSYIVAKQNAVTAQLVVDDALASGDSSALATAIDAYNTADSAAVQMATALPSDPTTIVTGAYSNTVDSLRTTYLTARERAAASDVYMRNYLGTSLDESTEAS